VKLVTLLLKALF